MRWLLVFFLFAPAPAFAVTVVYVRLAGDHQIALFALANKGTLTYRADTLTLYKTLPVGKTPWWVLAVELPGK